MAELVRRIVAEDVPRIKALLQVTFGNEAYVDMKRLTGMTNRSYKITREDGTAYVLRIPGEGTEQMINRSDEKKSNELACELGLDTSMFYFDHEGNKVMQFIESNRSVNEALMRETMMIHKVAEVFRRLHTSSVDTGVLFEVFAMAAIYENIIMENRIKLYPDYDKVKAQVMAVKANEDKMGIGAIVPCHNDPLPGNWILDDQEKLWLIDWEYAGMNDYIWDLACVSLECNYTEVEEKALLAAYYLREAQKEERQHFVAGKVYVDYLWFLWGLTRVPYEGEYMQEYADGRYRRLKKNLSSYVF